MHNSAGARIFLSSTWLLLLTLLLLTDWFDCRRTLRMRRWPLTETIVKINNLRIIILWKSFDVNFNLNLASFEISLLFGQVYFTLYSSWISELLASSTTFQNRKAMTFWRRYRFIDHVKVPCTFGDSMKSTHLYIQLAQPLLLEHNCIWHMPTSTGLIDKRKTRYKAYLEPFFISAYDCLGSFWGKGQFSGASFENREPLSRTAFFKQK